MPADNASPNVSNETTLNATPNAAPGTTSDTASGVTTNAVSNAASGGFPVEASGGYPGPTPAEHPGAMPDGYPSVTPIGCSGEAPRGYPSPTPAERPGAAPADIPYAAQNQGPSGIAIANMNAPAPTIDPEEQAAIRKLEERRVQARRKRIMKIAIVGGVIVALIGFWLVSGMLRSMSESKDNHPEVAVVKRGELSSSVQASGTLKPSSYVAVTPEVSGVIQDVMVVEGQQVVTGDDLLTINNSELEKALEDAGAALDHARQNLSLAEAGVSSAWDTYYEAIDKYNEAVEAANDQISNASTVADEAYASVYDAAIAAIPASATDEERKALEEAAQQRAQAAYDEAYAAASSVDVGTFEHSSYLSAIDAAQSSEISSQQALDDAQRAYDYAVEQANKRVVKAPASGTILDLVAVSGAAVGGASGGTSTANQALMQIADLAAFDVDVEINEVDIADVKTGQHAVITLSAIPDLELEGTVSSVASVASNAAGENGASGAAQGGVVSFKVTIKVNKPNDQLKPGMSASVKIMTKDEKDALIIPSSAVIEDGSDAYVMVASNEDATETEMRKIVIADRASTQVSVESGLKEGEIVLSQPLGDDSGSAASASASKA